MNRAELDVAFAAAVKAKSEALAAGDVRSAVECSATIISLARDVLEGRGASARPGRLRPEQDSAVFWAAYHPLRFAPPERAAEATVAFADLIDWMESYGHVFSEKELKIAGQLPFCGVPGMFERWIGRRVERGFDGESLAAAFDWLRTHPDVKAPECLIGWLAEHLGDDRRRNIARYAFALARAGRGEKRASFAADEVRRKPSDFRRWVALAECYPTCPRRIAACLARALVCTILPADEADSIRSSLERRLRSALAADGRVPPEEFDPARLSALAAPTDGFLSAGAERRRGILAGKRVAADGRRFAAVSWLDASGAQRRAEIPMPSALAAVAVGSALEIGVSASGGVEKPLAAKACLKKGISRKGRRR